MCFVCLFLCNLWSVVIFGKMFCSVKSYFWIHDEVTLCFLLFCRLYLKLQLVPPTTLILPLMILTWQRGTVQVSISLQAYQPSAFLEVSSPYHTVEFIKILPLKWLINDDDELLALHNALLLEQKGTLICHRLLLYLSASLHSDIISIFCCDIRFIKQPSKLGWGIRMVLFVLRYVWLCTLCSGRGLAHRTFFLSFCCRHWNKEVSLAWKCIQTN